MCSSAPTLSRSSLIERAFSERASDIHLEPQDGEMVVRMRIDGLLRRVLTVPSELQSTVISRLKIMGGMNIAEHIVVENEIADNMYQRSELDYLIYNAPLEYADLILNGDPETYLKTVTEYKPWDS